MLSQTFGRFPLNELCNVAYHVVPCNVLNMFESGTSSTGRRLGVSMMSINMKLLRELAEVDEDSLSVNGLLTVC